VSGLVIKNSASNWCLRVAAASTAGGAHIQQGACATGDTAAQWRVVASVTLNGYPYHQYQNVHSGLCMGVHTASTAGGAHILQGACSATTDHSQFWRTSDTGSGEYALINGHSGMCIGVVGSSTAENTDTDQGACAGTGTQAWITVAAPQ
jgi:Ricin-type beta-trefoil lectin domain